MEAGDAPVLEPDLHHPHVQAGVLRELLTYMAGGLGAVVVGGLQGLQLLGGDRGARSLVRLIAIQGPVQIETCNGDTSGLMGFKGGKRERGTPTLRLCLLVVALAYELAVLHQVELVARVQGAGAHGAEEALQMVDVVLSPPHHLRGRDAHITSGTLCTVTSVRPEHWQMRHGRRFFIKPSRLNNRPSAWPRPWPCI